MEGREERRESMRKNENKLWQEQSTRLRKVDCQILRVTFAQEEGSISVEEQHASDRSGAVWSTETDR
jgi:hypothetical protein